MTWPDIVNGLFECLGGVLLWANVIRLHRDKRMAGVSIYPTALFMLWGFWNLFYYPSLSQWWSFIGGINVVTANAVWVAQMWRYRAGEMQ